MSGKLPIDRVRDARDAPQTYDSHRERFAEKEATLRDAGVDDPVAGARPPDATDQQSREHLDPAAPTKGDGQDA